MKLLAFCLRFKIEEPLLRVNKSEITVQNAFHADPFEIEDNHKSSKNGENLVLDIFANLLLVL